MDFLPQQHYQEYLLQQHFLRQLLNFSNCNSRNYNSPCADPDIFPNMNGLVILHRIFTK